MQKLISHVTRPKHFALTMVAVAGVTLLGALMIASLALVGQNQDIRQQASEGMEGPTPTPNPARGDKPFLWFDVDTSELQSKNQLVGRLLINTWGNYIDGTQVVAYLSAPSDFQGSLNDQFEYVGMENGGNFELEPFPLLGDHASIQSNSIIFEPDKNRYRIEFAIISNDPNTPINSGVVAQHPMYFQGVDLVMAVFPIKPKPNFNSSLELNFTFNYQLSKMIEHTSGADLIDQQNQAPTTEQTIAFANYQFYPQATATPTVVPPTATPTASPSATPTPKLPSPTPTEVLPTPTPTPTIGQMSVINIYFRPEEYINPTYPYNPINDYQAVLWDTQNNEQISLSDQEVVTGASGVLIYKASYDISYLTTNGTTAKLYFKLRKHHSFTVDLTLPKTAYIPTAVSLTSELIKAGEITGDNIIDLEDYHQLVKRFNPGVIAGVVSPISDLNHDGMTDISDYAILANNFDIEYQSPLFPN